MRRTSSTSWRSSEEYAPSGEQAEIIEFDEDELSSACGSENNEPLEALEAADAFLIKTDADDAADLLIE